MSELSRRKFIKGAAGLAGGAATALLLPSSRLIYGQEVQQESWVLHWDGEWKRRNTFSGTKFVFIPGLGEHWKSTTFNKVKQQVLEPLGFDRYDFLDMTYKIAEGTKLLGLPYFSDDSTQNPQYVLYAMHKMIKKYKEDFRDEKRNVKDAFWLLGFSNGGYFAYELARLFPDDVEGVVTFGGALTGADIVPSGIDTALSSFIAPIIGGEAGSYHLKRGQDPGVADQVAREVFRMRRRQQVFITLASSDDSVVREQHAFIPTSDTVIKGRRINGRFPMEEWEEPVPPDYIDEQLTILDRILGEQSIPPAQKEAIKRRVRGGQFGHRAVTQNPLVLSELKAALHSSIASLNDPLVLLRQGEQAWGRQTRRIQDEILAEEEAVSHLIAEKLPYQESRFTLFFDTSINKFILRIPSNVNEEDAAIDIDRFMQVNMVNLNSNRLRRSLLIERIAA